MTQAFLQSELASLIQDSKRRQSDVRTAAEKIFADLKAIQVTSEAQLAGDLLRRPQFIEPFILACNSKHVRLALTGAVCLQRLIASKAVAPSKLPDVLDAFQEATQQGFDVQLKVLQALPSLLQLYTSELQGDALAKVLSLCASLAGSKTPLVSSTANATFQQLISALFEKQTGSISAEGNESNEDSEDVSMVFNDMCLVIKGEQPQFLRPQGLTLSLALEVVELSLSNQNVPVLEIPSCSVACETVLIPGLIQVLEKSTSFSCYGHSLRILYLLIFNALERMLDSLSDAFKIVLHTMDRPSGPHWRRLLCLEFMRGLISDSQLVRTIYAVFDHDKDKASVVGGFMSILVRIAAEDPALIGLGRQSTIPTNTEDESATIGGAPVDVDTVGSVLQASANVTGISSKWSTLSPPLLEQIDKTTTPDVPATYIYTLVLGCVASFSDGLSKFVMPLSVPNRSPVESLEGGENDVVPTRKSSQARRAGKYQRLLNPIKRDDLDDKGEILVCAKLIEDCWPAVLATCSTFLNSALDSYFYHTLVRTVQKLAQVSGVLELFTPRDALLTTLAKVSVPVNASSIVTALHGNKLARVSKVSQDPQDDDAALMSPATPALRHSVDVSRQPLNVRNLLCLRALLNLGIALGPTLSDTSWHIIIQALQQVDALTSVNPASRNSTSKQSAEDADIEGHMNMGSEINAVGTASKRMMESTKTYSDESLEMLLRSVFKMVDSLVSEFQPAITNKQTNGNQDLNIPPMQHKVQRSVSGVQNSNAVLHTEAEFVLKTINDLARINLYRFCSSRSRTCTWELFVPKLLLLVADVSINPTLRLQAANILDTIATETARAFEKHDQDNEDVIDLQSLSLDILAKQLSHLYKKVKAQSVLATDVDIHRHLLEALENIVSNSGESLTTGWRKVFDILQKTTRQTNSTRGSNSGRASFEQELILDRTLPPAFRTVQLIVSDFLNTIDPTSFSILVQLLPSFGLQANDLNISLTTTVLFSNLSFLLLERTDRVNVPLTVDESTQVHDDTESHTKRKATDVSSLWLTIVTQLSLLCKDSRSDVRNSALQVLIRMFESASTQLTPETWNVALREAFLPILVTYCNKELEIMQWNVSYASLLQGLVSLFVQNTEAIANIPDFSTTWKAMVEVLEIKLAQQTFEGHTIVFSAAAKLLQALGTANISDHSLTHPVLQCWSTNQPVRIPIDEQPNQDAFSSSIKLLTVIMEEASRFPGQLAIDGQDLVQLAMHADKASVLASIHSQYSSDVMRMSAEQSAIAINLGLLKSMMQTRKQAYTAFVLDIVTSILTRNTSTVDQQKVTVGSKNLKRPTLIAFMSHCISILRTTIQEEGTSSDLILNMSFEIALPILTKVAATKYTRIPVSTDTPVWRTATSAVVEIVEAMQALGAKSQIENISLFSVSITQALEAVITAPALENKSPQPSTDVIATDEAFDIEHVRRLYNASISLIEDPQLPLPHLQKYVMVLFHASLAAKPWFGDLPEDLDNNPLADLRQLRPGSIRPPEFPLRTNIPYEALDMLLKLVAKPPSGTPSEGKLRIAKVAAPYVILRTAHTIKVFMADQYLRNLIPPPKPTQRELSVVLSKAMELDVVNAAFDGLLSSNPNSTGDDCKVHLRIMYPLVLRFREFWTKLPKLKVCAWQDEDDGKLVSTVLEQWGDVVAEAWRV